MKKLLSERGEAQLIVVFCWMILLLQILIIGYQIYRHSLQVQATRMWQEISRQLDAEIFWTEEAVFIMEETDTHTWEVRQIR